MNCFSHLAIGEYLRQYLQEHHGMTLSQDAFVHGNALPDFRMYYKSMPHEPKFWAHYIQSEIGSLSHERSDSLFFDPDFSRRLGVICHFYADFFCFPHTSGFTDGTIRHFKYEWTLHRRLRGQISRFDLTDFGGLPEGLNEKQIFAGFLALHRDYLSQPPSFDLDITYTLRACIDMVTAVLANAGAGVTPSGDMPLPLPTA